MLLRSLGVATSLTLGATMLTVVAAAPAQAADVDVTIVGTNDFHGRIKADGAVAGAAAIATYVKQVRAGNANTVFAAAGDLIGGSTFESYIARDKPTIDALNAAGLDVSAVGNHELDKGYQDLVGRVMAPASAANPEGGVGWRYLAANVVEPGGADAIKASMLKTFNEGTPDAVSVGFVGAVTEHLPELVAPAGISGLQVTDVVAAVNAEAAALTAAGADAVVLLVHEGAPSTDCSTMAADPASDFGSVVTGVSGDVDAIISGHTHLAYDCDLPKPGGGTRPVVSAGQYGTMLNRLDLKIDPAAGTLTSITAEPVALTTKNADSTYTPLYPDDPATKAIVDAAVAAAAVKGSVAIGRIAAPFERASRPSASGGTREENRGGESTLGNLVAESQRWATRTATSGAAQIAFTNPGGLRADLVGNNSAGYPAQMTYKQAADVQPFANTLVNMRLTGAQLRRVLEQQWQPPGAARPFLRLGVSLGFNYVYDPVTRRVTAMWLGNKPVVDDQSYSVTVSSYLAGGGDSFSVFTEGTGRRDTGQTDLDALVSYVAARTKKKALPVSYRQRAVGLSLPAGAPASYAAGDVLRFRLSSLAFTGAGDKTDAHATVEVGRYRLGTVRRISNAVAPGATDDEAGRVDVAFRVPGGMARGVQVVEVTGATTGTVVRYPIRFTGDRLRSTMKARISGKRLLVGRSRPTVTVRVAAEGQPATGLVRVRTAGQSHTVSLRKGVAKVRLAPFRKTGPRGIRVTFLPTLSTVGARQALRVRVVRHR